MVTAIVLTAIYIACQMIADVSAVKLVSVFGLAVPAGTFVYAVTFTVRDMIHKRMGKKAARLVISSAAVINVAMALYFAFTVGLAHPPFWGGQEAYAAVLGVVPTIVVASIAAEYISEMFDTELYQIAWDTFAKDKPWLRIAFSNLFSVPLDSFIFGALAFKAFPWLFGGDAIPWAGIGTMVLGQSIFKWVVATAVIPFTYLTKPGRPLETDLVENFKSMGYND